MLRDMVCYDHSCLGKTILLITTAHNYINGKSKYSQVARCLCKAFDVTKLWGLPFESSILLSYPTSPSTEINYTIDHACYHEVNNIDIYFRETK